MIGGIGTLSGGWLADRLRRDKRMYVWLTAGVKLAILPIAIWYYLTTDLLTAIILTSITSFFGGFYLSVSFALNQNCTTPRGAPRLGALVILHQYCRPRIRAAIGRHFIRLFLGRLWRRRLRYALIAVVSLNLWGCFHYFWAGRNLREDLKIAERHQRFDL